MIKKHNYELNSTSEHLNFLEENWKTEILENLEKTDEVLKDLRQVNVIKNHKKLNRRRNSSLGKKFKNLNQHLVKLFTNIF